MAQPASPSPEPSQADAMVYHPRIIRGADDQASAYEAWLAQWADVDADEDARAWRMVQRRLQQTRKELGQRPLFPE